MEERLQAVKRQIEKLRQEREEHETFLRDRLNRRTTREKKAEQRARFILGEGVIARHRALWKLQNPLPATVSIAARVKWEVDAEKAAIRSAAEELNDYITGVDARAFLARTDQE